MHLVFLRAFHQLSQAEEGTDKLGNNSGQSRRSYTPVKDAYKQKIQHNVYNGGDDQIDKGMPAVSYGLKDSYHEVVHDKGKRTAKINTEISNRVRKHFRRRSHKDKDLRRRKDSYKSQDYSADQTKCHNGVDRPLNNMILFGAVILGDYDSGADCQSVEESHHQKDQIPGRADSRQGGASQKSSHDKRIGGVIKLLKKIAEKKRYGKKMILFQIGPDVIETAEELLLMM